ncbi:hypothetical protein FJZ19_00330 [Candidatus Pacearchaeota archaeon]|nr:hypothetical protein [Candidatus Pacearchaeota archaeon]
MKKEIVKINRNKLIKGKAGVSYLQIFILVLSTFAFAWMIASIDEASAENEQCCPEDKYGRLGQDYPSSTCAQECTKTCLPTKCSELSDYQTGCCYDAEEGTCSVNSPKATCIRQHGSWDESENCNINSVPECRLGCCILGGNTMFVTSRRCEKLSAESGLRTDFRAAVNTEFSCLALGMAQKKGACMLNNGGCKILTGQECSSLTGRNNNFYQDILCTSSLLNSSCTKTEETTCVDGRDEVYFKDTCGNPANIYYVSQINNQSYWERIIPKENSCFLESANGNAGSKTCGNCNYYLGSKCKDYKETGIKPDKGNYICSDLSCKNAPANVGKQDRRNGESWCVYDGSIGVVEGNKFSSDVVGSRHFKYSCIEGEVKSEPCADFRNEICVQSDTSTALGEFSSASCRVNQWQKCINSNANKDGCTGFDCFVKNVNVDKGFKFDICAPKYPEGFDLSTEAGGKAAEQICGMATQTCTVIYIKDMKGKCKCEQNCNCEKIGFTQQMNDLCISLGDCGAYVNILGKVTDAGYTVSGAPKILLEQYKKYATPVAGQKVESGTIQQLVGNLTSLQELGMPGGEKEKEANLMYGLGIAGAGLIIDYMNGGTALSSLTKGVVGARESSMFAGIFSGGGGAGGAASGATSVPATFQGFAYLSEGGTKMAIIELTGQSGPSLFYVPYSPEISVAPTAMGGESINLAADTILLDSAGNSVGSVGEIAAAEGITTPPAPITSGVTPGAVITAFSNLLVVTAIIMTIAPLILRMLGIQTSQTGMFAGTAAGVTAAYTAATIYGMNVYGWSFGQALTYALTGALEGGISASGIGIGGLSIGNIVFGVIVAIIIMSFFEIMGVGKVCKTVKVTYTCKPWQPPVGGSDCDKCSQDALKPCSKYRCQSLGTACRFFNEGTSQEKCSAVADNGQAPVISPWYEILNGNFSYMNVSNTGFKIREKDGSCIPVFTPFLFGIKTDKISQCKIDVASKAKYEDMAEYFGDSNLYLENHSMGFSMPSREAAAELLGLNQSDAEIQFVLDKLGSMRLYTRCQDAFGKSSQEYVIDICTREGPDKTAPMIVSTNPLNNAFVAFNQTDKEINIFVNEKADCRWSKQDKNYTAMENSFVCNSNSLLWQCNTTLTNLAKGENTFYFKCKDHPEWEGTANQSNRNVNVESYVYKLKVPQTQLTITKIEPNGTFSFGSEPISINLRAETSGGAENGKAICSWVIGNWYDIFRNTGSNVHRATLTSMPAGEYNLDVICVDAGFNYATASSNFKLSVDTSAPYVTRVYNSQGDLYIFTNENSECAYSRTDKNCGFIFENGTLMQGGFTQEHFAEWNSQQNYYIKCRDAWRNEPYGCSIKVRTYNRAA